MRAVAVIPGRIRGSGSFSTRPRSKFFGGGQPGLKSTLASTEIRSTVAAKSLPGTASILTVAVWPTLSRPRSDSSRRASRWIDDRSGSSRTCAPAHARSPFAELDLAAEHAAVALVRHDVDDAGRGRLDHQRGEPLLRAVEVELRLVALAPLRRSRRPPRRSCRTSPSARASRSFCSASATRQLRLLVFELRHEVALAEIELGAIEVVSRAHHRGLVLLRRDPLLRLHLRDLGVGLLQLGLLLLHPLPQRRRVELDEDVARLHRAAVLHELQDLQLAPPASARRARSTSPAGSRRGPAGSR